MTVFVIAPSVRDGRLYLSQLPQSMQPGYRALTGPEALRGQVCPRVIVLGEPADYPEGRGGVIGEVLASRMASVQYDSVIRVLRLAVSVGSVAYSELPATKNPRQP